MKILHYTLGLPPMRSGGLTRYSVDLMLCQREQGIRVGVLSAGGLNCYYPQKRIIKKKNWNDILQFEIKNPVVTPILHGIKSPAQISDNKNKLSEDQMELLLKKIQPDIFHIHTLMGLPLELVEYLKNKGTKIIYTSHDYYGLCMKVNFINEEGIFCTNPSGINCARCNYYSPSSIFLRLRNSKLLLRYKKFLPSKNNHSPRKLNENISLLSSEVTDYENLISYYKQFYPLIDTIHFNSGVAKSIYSKYINTEQSCVIPVSHNGIVDNRQSKNIDQKAIRITFIGSVDNYKGFPLLKRNLMELTDYQNWTLNVWGGARGVDQDCQRIKYCGKYSQAQMSDIYTSTDILVVPSIWGETFSLITLEALSFGVPVLVSSNVGAKDIVRVYNSEFVYETEADLRKILRSIFIDVSQLKEYNNRILNLPWNYSFHQHVNEVSSLYNKIINENSIH